MKYASCLVGVAAALLGLGSSVFAQDVAPAAVTPPAVLPGPSAAEVPVPGGVTAHPPGISSWLAYPRSPICCGNVGKDGPIFGEIYTRAGVSQPFGSSRFSTDMNTGFSFTVGSRTLLFNPAADRAWVIDFGISNTWWSMTDAATFTLLDTPLPNTNLRGTQLVTPVRLHVMTFDLSLGQEYYAWGTAACDGTSKCRFGWDAGGRYGSSRLDFRVIQHRTDAVGGAFLAAHTDYECPLGSCMFHAGARVEYGYLFNDLLQRQNDTDVQTVNVLLTAGLRF
ncbi:MAG: hypothetical protein ACRC33_19155 [Gemmataceae bacterium]